MELSEILKILGGYEEALGFNTSIIYLKMYVEPDYSDRHFEVFDFLDYFKWRSDDLDDYTLREFTLRELLKTTGKFKVIPTDLTSKVNPAQSIQLSVDGYE